MVQTAFIEVPMMHVSQQVGHCHFPNAIAFLCAESLPLKEKVSKDEVTFKYAYAVVPFAYHCYQGQSPRDTF
jgi:hypothetical protein